MMDSSFEAEFDAYMAGKRQWMKDTYNRVLPSGELIFNRFDKAEYLSMGQDSSVYDTSVVMGDVTVGEHVWIGPYTVLEGINGKLTIGDWVSINAGVMIYTHDTTKKYLSGGIDEVVKGPVTIGDHTVIATLSTVGCGVTIGDHCVVGAYSMVTGDIPPYSIAAGVPAKVIGRVVEDEGHIRFEYFGDQPKENAI